MPTALHQHHAALRERFLLHQEALIGLDLDLAQQRLRDHASALREHIRCEERLLLPRYATCNGEVPRGGSVTIFFDEHRKIERLLEQLEGLLSSLCQDPSHPQLRRGVLKLLEREILLTHLLEHHEHREESILLPTLQTELGEQGLADLLVTVFTSDGSLEPDSAAT